MAEIKNHTNDALVLGTNNPDSIYNYTLGKGYTGDRATLDASEGDDTINNSGGLQVIIEGGEGNDIIKNDGISAIINGGEDNDSINNGGTNALINGGTGNDTIRHYSSNSTISGDIGDDLISLASYSQYNLIKYRTGDGNDSIIGFNADDSLQIAGNSYSTAKIGSDVIITVGDDKISLIGAASLESISIDGTLDTKPTVDTAILMLTDGNDTLKNTSDGAKILALDGNDSIRIYGDSVSLDAGAGDDSIRNYGDNVTICGGIGNDTLRNAFGENVLFKYAAGDGSDVIIGFNETSTLQIDGGAGSYSTRKSGSNMIVTVGSGKLTLAGAAALNTLNIAGTKKTYKTLSLTDKSSDKITLPSTYIAVSGSKRTKAIKVTGNSLDNTITGGSGKDTLLGGAGSDSLWGQAGADTFIYAEGTGKDVIYGFDSDNLLQITGDWTALITSAGAVSFKVGATYNSVVLKDFTATTFNVNGTAYTIRNGKFVTK